MGRGKGEVILLTDTVWEARSTELTAITPDAEFVVLGESPVSDADIERLTIGFFSADAWPGRTSALMGPVVHAPHLHWLHTFSAGLDDPVFARLSNRGVRVTNSPGAAAPAIAASDVISKSGAPARENPMVRPTPSSFSSLARSAVPIAPDAPITTAQPPSGREERCLPDMVFDSAI